MGFFNWLLKNGPGSPGSTASAIVKLYNQINVENHSEEWEGAFFAIFMVRYNSYQRMGFAGGCLLNQVDANIIIQKSKGDLPFFVFIMMLLETAQFRNNVSQQFFDVTKIIHDTVKEKNRTSVILDLPRFQYLANQINL